MSRRENFYRRDPHAALAGMVGLTPEERGVYNTVLDLLYSTWRPLDDDRRFIANWCGCAVQKLNPILARLIDKGKLVAFQEGGRPYLSNPAFDREREAVKGPSKTRSGRGDVSEKSGEVGEKSGEVGHNPPLLDTENTEKQALTALEREEKRREENPLPPNGVGKADRRKPRVKIPADFPDQQTIEDTRQRLRTAGVNLDATIQAERFRNHAEQTDRRCASWPAAWRNWISKASETAPKVAPVLSGKPDPEARWRRLLKEFRANGYWPSDPDAGPKPGKPGCVAPSALLLEFGFTPPDELPLRVA